MSVWLLKTEPSEFSFDDLVAHAPEDCRLAMITNVPLHRQVMAAIAGPAATVLLQPISDPGAHEDLIGEVAARCDARATISWEKKISPGSEPFASTIEREASACSTAPVASPAFKWLAARRYSAIATSRERVEREPVRTTVLPANGPAA